MEKTNSAFYIIYAEIKKYSIYFGVCVCVWERAEKCAYSEKHSSNIVKQHKKIPPHTHKNSHLLNKTKYIYVCNQFDMNFISIMNGTNSFDCFHIQNDLAQKFPHLLIWMNSWLNYRGKMFYLNNVNGFAERIANSPDINRIVNRLAAQKTMLLNNSRLQ